MILQLLALAIGLLLMLLAYSASKRLFVSPMATIPGPFLARFTDAWYLWRVQNGRFEQENLQLHRRYGPIVRYGPSRFSFDDFHAAKTIYRYGGQYEKSSWYDAWATPGQWNLFADRSNERHARNRRAFQSMYSMSSVVHHEPFVDQCNDILIAQLDAMSELGDVVDLGHWFQCYAFDVIGHVTYGERLGFLDDGKDIGDIIAALESHFLLATLCGIYPSLHPYILALKTYLPSIGNGGRQYVAKFTREMIQLSNGSKAAAPQYEDHLDISGCFLTKFLAKQASYPETFSNYHVFAGCVSNMVAGSDTTAISLSAVLYYLLKNPSCLDTLQTEVDEAYSHLGRFENPTFKQTLELPYLQAVIKETLRLHPATGLPLERVVPDGGAVIAGVYFPAGTIVGVNCWVQHRNRLVFGDDADTFRPERWLAEGGIADISQYWMPFGLGSRTCLGKNISMLEMAKLIPRIVRHFDFHLDASLQEPGASWETTNRWFVKPKRFKVLVGRRLVAI